MRVLTALAILLLPLAAACEKEDADVDDVPAGAAAPAHDTLADHNATNQLKDAWVAAADKKDAATVANFYTDDAVFVAENGAVYNGRAEIQKAFGDVFPLMSNLKVDEKSFVAVGDVAYATGDFKETITSPAGKATDIDGHYLVVFRRQPDGSWKLVRHQATAVAPPAPVTGG